jgi:Kelch motif
MLPIILHSSLLFLVVRSAYSIEITQNYSICNWARLRSGLIRDAIYLDGGQLWWQTAFADGSTPVVASDGNVAGDMWRLNLSTSFDTSTSNLSALLVTMPKAGGAGNNIAPNYIDGTMFTNDDELYLYGGLPRLTDSVSPQSEYTVLGYEAHQFGPQRDSWAPGFYQGSLTAGVTRYITNGAGVSAPSENLGFYFSGMRSPDWGPIYYDDASANTTAGTLIQVDMSVMRSEEWTNTTLPDNILPRADADLVWLPVSQNGVLLAIGGVTATEEISPMGLNESQISESESVSPSFMTSIPIYDVASKTWYLQNTTGSEAPPQLTEFCSVVSTTADGSTFNIHIYGGYDGISSSSTPSDDVWILSIPSFTWTKAYSGTPSHGRSGHQCTSPYPDKMFVIGGIHQNQAQCVEGGFIQVFNLNTLQFQNTYDPEDWEEYRAPASVSTATGGNRKRQVAWSNPALADIFATKYTKEMNHYYPYPPENKSSDDGGNSSPAPKKKPNHTIAIAVGVAAGVVCLILCVVVFLIVRRRHIMRSNASESTATRQSRVSRWLIGTRLPVPPAKHHLNDSVSSLAPEIQQIDSHPSGPVSSSGPSTPSPINHHLSYARTSQPQEMAAVERPLPPFEMATPYNSQDHPRNSHRVSYNYSSAKGHSPSRSTSSDYEHLDPIQEHSPINSNTHLHPSDAYDQARANSDAHTSTNSTSSTSSTLAWPFPAADKNCSPTPSNEPAPVPPIPPKYQNQNYRSTLDHTTPDRLRPIMPEDELSTNSSQSVSSGPKVSDISSSSKYERGDLESLPSPETSLPLPGTKQGDDIRRRLLERVEPGLVSPISPETANGPGWKGVWGYGAREPPRPAEWRPPMGRRSGSGEREGNENWWK